MISAHADYESVFRVTVGAVEKLTNFWDVPGYLR